MKNAKILDSSACEKLKAIRSDMARLFKSAGVKKICVIRYVLMQIPGLILFRGAEGIQDGCPPGTVKTIFFFWDFFAIFFIF